MSKNHVGMETALADARASHGRANSYLYLATAVLLGLAFVLALGFMEVPGLGLFTQGTAMVMIGGALTVLSFGLVGALIAARRALRTVETFAELMAAQATRHADELALAAKTTAEHQQKEIEELANFESRQAAAFEALAGEERRTETAVTRLLGREEVLEQRVAALKAEESALIARVTADENDEMIMKQNLESRIDSTHSIATKTDHLARKAVNALDDERARLQRTVGKVMSEERERKEEFEALAAEEIRLMGRVRKNEAAIHGSAREDDEKYRIARPKGSVRGPFGEVYAISEVDGISKARAERLREVGITNSEHLWRANPTFVANVLHCDRKTVELWQEEAELMAIHGIGRERAKILVESGVTSIEKLAHQKPQDLVTLVNKGHRKGTRAGVTPANASTWIAEAHRLE